MAVSEHPFNLHRRRLLAQIDLEFETLTDAQNATVDEILWLLPAVDSPTLLQTVEESDRPRITQMLATLPQTRFIERVVEGHWPQ